MKTKRQQIEEIHLSLLNGQRKQMTGQIDNYGLYDFFEDYNDYLYDLYLDSFSKLSHFTDCVISYHRIKNR